ncbi:helix-turn-helix domain-containing protein [Chitinophaga sp.]|uniref:helix-turn-helix domain-containing protein n=1 Tax=Chitinophaga sp. TaxID=1869181 RepID=UPI0031CEA410
MIYALTCGSLFLLSFLLISTSGKVNIPANRWLGIFFFCVGCAIASVIVPSDMVSLTELTRFAMAPALYISVIHYTNGFKNTAYWHFLPAGLFLMFVLPEIILNKHIFSLPSPYSQILGWIMGRIVKVQFFLYMSLSIYRLMRYPMHLPWLRYLLWSTCCMMFIWFSGLHHYTAGIYLVTVFGLGFFAARQKDYSAAALKPAIPDRLKTRLEDLMTRERIYTDSDLDLSSLAEKMAISVHEMSALLNNGYGQNFNQFVNAYRITLAKELLLSEKHAHLTILGIAFEAGFNSKTTFNTTFKKATGVSPSDWKKSGSEL